MKLDCLPSRWQLKKKKKDEKSIDKKSPYIVYPLTSSFLKFYPTKHTHTHTHTKHSEKDNTGQN